MLGIVYAENNEQIFLENREQFYLMQKTDFINAVSIFEYTENMMYREQILLMYKKFQKVVVFGHFGPYLLLVLSVENMDTMLQNVERKKKLKIRKKRQK